ncbi:Cholesterol 24-hydroxylase OS=Mus musculus GN=Cyp46a1 PE=2 SV=1 [Rhizoctonia solani AG-1 IB]|uniref:Cholesterol 24-hydroxylase n=1 Tax=Thanatephorus cucumeris (strain AG1-IB / isolate 7/3/14) TaxID=1108050 RepID=A0A0B7G3K3_THACB|nr:Cholesterol 24-hydroxylase OS=Mus musculus GN=Cyp46a1 PE=2 SV=1 [Rhizoctonia solani AG-1 IB]
MFESRFAFDLNQAHLLLDRVAMFVQTHPFESSVALAVASLGGYTMRHFITPSHYPNIDGPSSNNIVFGHLYDIHSAQGTRFHDGLQDKYGSVCKVEGIFGKENLFVSDPRFVHEVLVKGVDITFSHPKSMYDFLTLSFGPGLLSTKGGPGALIFITSTKCLSGDVHKAQRKMLNPVFTAKHMKSLAAIFNTIAQNMKKSMIEDIRRSSAGKEIDVLRWCSATALELIGQAGLGHTFGVLEGGDSKYSHSIKNFLPAMTKVIPLRGLFPFFYNLGPASLRRKLADLAPLSAVQHLREIINVQDEQARMILDQKKDKLRSGKVDVEDEAHDIMSVLLKANMEADEKDRLPEDQLLGQMNTLIFAGHETTSGALARILQLLAMDLEMQDRLRTELLEAPMQLTYDDLHNLPYLDAICRETLRLYPPAPLLERVALADCTIPLRYPMKGKNGEEIREIRVRKGTDVYISLKEANRAK